MNEKKESLSLCLAISFELFVSQMCYFCARTIKNWAFGGDFNGNKKKNYQNMMECFSEGGVGLNMRKNRVRFQFFCIENSVHAPNTYLQSSSFHET